MNVMKRAWEIAKQGQAKFGGTVKEYFAAALKMAWAFNDEFRVTKIAEVPFGKAKAIIEVKGYVRNQLHSVETLWQLTTIDKVYIVSPEGVVVTEGYASELDLRSMNDANRRYFNRDNKLDNDKSYTKVGLATCVGLETAKLINSTIAKFVDDIEELFNLYTGKDIETTLEKKERELKERKEIAQETVKKAELQISIPSSKELRTQMHNYNKVLNEGDEGYLPTRNIVTLESYNKAKALLAI